MKSFTPSAFFLAAFIALAGASEPDAPRIEHQVVFSLTPQPDGKTVKCAFARSQDVNYAKHEVHASSLRPSASFVENACKRFLAQYWHTWDFMKGKPDEDYCLWSKDQPDEPLFPVIAPS